MDLHKILEIKIDGYCSFLTLSKDGNLLYFLSNSSLFIYDIPSTQLKKVIRYSEGNYCSVVDLKINETGDAVAILFEGCSRGGYFDHDKYFTQLLVINSKNDQQRLIVNKDFFHFSLSFEEDSRIIFDNEIRIDGTLIGIDWGKNNEIACKCSPLLYNEQFSLFTKRNLRLELKSLNIETPSPELKPITIGESFVDDFLWSINKNHLAWSCYDKTIKVKTNRNNTMLLRHDSNVTGFTWIDDNSIISITENGKIRLWRNGEEIQNHWKKGEIIEYIWASNKGMHLIVKFGGGDYMILSSDCFCHVIDTDFLRQVQGDGYLRYIPNFDQIYFADLDKSGKKLQLLRIQI